MNIDVAFPYENNDFCRSRHTLSSVCAATQAERPPHSEHAATDGDCVLSPVLGPGCMLAGR